MTPNELRLKYINFFVENYNHKQISGFSLIPENDPTVLFTTAGMHPLVPYLMGQSHPAGKKIVNYQKCLRTDDIEEVGDTTHLTFFEMMGNWSLGDYFKEESIQMSYLFLTDQNKGLGLHKDKLCVSCFEGDKDAPKDEDAAKKWESLGFTRWNQEKDHSQKIFFFNKKENWWGPAGETGPCGPDTEIFYIVDQDKCSNCDKKGPSCDCGRYVEIWNNVFMEYDKKENGSYIPLAQKNVDTGLGLERVYAIIKNKPTVFETELFISIIQKIEELSSKKYQEEPISFRVIADHLRAATFLLGDPSGVTPSNTDQGYILRRLIRRAIRHGRKLGIDGDFIHLISAEVIETYKIPYLELEKNKNHILDELKREEVQFQKTLKQGERECEKAMSKSKNKTIDGNTAFHLYDTYGFPIEITKELAEEKGFKIDEEGFHNAFKAHQELSRKGAQEKFKGGLADHSEITIKYHTATHLLHQALKDVLGDHINQKGSNITSDRLRFDFSHDQKMTAEEKEKVTEIINHKIQEGLKISVEEMDTSKAKKTGALGLFGDRYGDLVKIYSIGDYSKEICGGPHVQNTRDLGTFKIKKEESSSRGVRRIKAILQ